MEEEELCSVGPRTDYYFRLSGSDSLGIKLREGKIEVKPRLRQHGVVTLHERVSGLVEEWRKWSYELADTGTDSTHKRFPDSFWIGVDKVRTLCKYEVTSGREILAVPADAFPDEGGQLELTRLAVLGDEWWTMGFEAWGQKCPMQENLNLVMGHVLADSEPPVFDAEDSYSYPKWLAQVL
jgi:hypothetical protein